MEQNNINNSVYELYKKNIDQSKEYTEQEKKDLNIILKYVFNQKNLTSEQYYNLLNKNKKYGDYLVKILNELKEEIDKLNSPQQPQYNKAITQDKKIANVLAAVFFNSSYKIGKLTTLRKNIIGQYKVKTRLTLILDENGDIKTKDNSIAFFPLDLMLFSAFRNHRETSNGRPTLISLNDAYRYALDDPNARITQDRELTQYNFYTDRMKLFNNTYVEGIIEDHNGDIIKTFEGVILQSFIEKNKRANEVNSIKYLVGYSVFDFLEASLKDLTGIDYWSTYSVARQYMNDGQKNTLAIANMKSYIFYKIMQQKNAKERKNVYNGNIPLENLYNATALISGNGELDRTEKKRLREKMIIYLNYLKDKGIITSYSMTPFNKKDNEIAKANAPINNIHFTLKKEK